MPQSIAKAKRYNQAASLYWAERAMSPLTGFEPMEVKGDLGFVHGFVLCIGNFDAVEAQRRSNYALKSADRKIPIPIWC